jgi:hypothetical protein
MRHFMNGPSCLVTCRWKSFPCRNQFLFCVGPGENCGVLNGSLKGLSLIVTAFCMPSCWHAQEEGKQKHEDDARSRCSQWLGVLAPAAALLGGSEPAR